MTDFFLLCGLPYSGKTHVRKRLMQLLDNPQVVSLDDHVLAAAELNHLTYQEAFERFSGEAGRAMYAEFYAGLKKNRPIIVDMTHVTERSRVEKLSKVPQHYRKFVVICEAPSSIRTLRRAERIDQVVPLEVLRNMERHWEPPTHREGFHAILYAQDILHARAEA